MFKKSIYLSILMFLNNTFSYAFSMYTPYQPGVYKAGLYAGLSVGPKIASSSLPLFYEGAEGTLSVGWGHIWSDYLYWQRIYTAVEGFVGDSIALKKFGPNNPTQVVNARTGFSYGIDGILGYMLNPYALMYVRSGVSNTQFDIFTVNSGASVDSIYQTGWRIGGGLQANVYQNLDLRTEYIFTLYPNQTNPNNIGRQWTNLFNLGVVYRFV